MGVRPSKHRKSGLCEKDVKALKGNNNNNKGENKKATMKVYERVRESNGSGSLSSNNNNNIMATTYEREMMGFAFKKAEWKQERKKLKDEVKALRALVEEKDERIREERDKFEAQESCVGVGVGDNNNNNKNGGVFFSAQKWGFLGGHDLILVDQMREERARRDETVEKWKQLYLAIKMELDDLIQRTHEGGLYWRAQEEDMAEELKKELQAKEETIKELKSKLVSMEKEMFKREREVDILRQSLKIMSSKKVLQPKNPPKKVVPKQGVTF